MFIDLKLIIPYEDFIFIYFILNFIKMIIILLNSQYLPENQVKLILIILFMVNSWYL